MPYRIRKTNCKRSDGKKGKYVLEYIPKGKRKYKRAGCHTSKKNAHGQRAAIEGGPRESFERDLETLLEAIDLYLLEKKKRKKKRAAPKDSSGHLRQYGAPKGSKRAAQLDKAKELYAKGDIEGSIKIRTDMENKEREKQNESLDEIDDLIMEILEERKKRKKRKSKTKKKKKKGSASGGLSAATKKSLDKKADRRGLTRGSVYREFRAGLAAWASSGSRKGMSQHQWAHARVNSATPSKSWAVVKKSKAKKKKK